MKARVNQKKLVAALKYLKALAKFAPENAPEAKDIVALVVDNGTLTLMGGPKLAAAAITLEAEDTEDGVAFLGFRLHDLIKACKDSQITLTKGKGLTISGDSGFKATLAIHTGKIAVDVIKKHMERAYESYATFFTEDIQALVDISLVLNTQDEPRWISLTQDGESYIGAAQRTAEESLDSYTLQGTGTLLNLQVDTQMLNALLQGRGKEIIMGKVEGVGAYRIEDPNDPNWWGMLSMLSLRGSNA